MLKHTVQRSRQEVRTLSFVLILMPSLVLTLILTVILTLTLILRYSCKDNYAPGKQYAGWCDKECGYGTCSAA